MNNVGSLDWSDCPGCKHYRKDLGGCAPLDAWQENILRININLNIVECVHFEPEKT